MIGNCGALKYIYIYIKKSKHNVFMWLIRLVKLCACV